MKIFRNVSDGSVISQGQPFIANGVAYPFNWLDLASADDLEAHGISVRVEPDPVPDEPVPPGSPGPPTLITVTPRQARLALFAAGLLDQVEAAVSAAGGATKITWDFATYISRNDPLIETLGSALSLSSAQIDELFDVASTL